jgi:hypothetical protein
MTLIIFKKLITINKYNFRFINVKPAHMIISMMKLLMEVSLF